MCLYTCQLPFVAYLYVQTWPILSGEQVNDGELIEAAGRGRLWIPFIVQAFVGLKPPMSPEFCSQTFLLSIFEDAAMT